MALNSPKKQEGVDAKLGSLPLSEEEVEVTQDIGGEVKAVAAELEAVLDEIGNRRDVSESLSKYQVDVSEDGYPIFSADAITVLDGLEHAEVSAYFTIPEGDKIFVDQAIDKGLLKNDDHFGVMVKTVGVPSYDSFRAAKTAEDIGEYDLYIQIPGALQKENECVVLHDECVSLKDSDHDISDWEIKREHENAEGGYVVVRLPFRAKGEDADFFAGKRSLKVHDRIVAFIEGGRELAGLQDYIDQVIAEEAARQI